MHEKRPGYLRLLEIQGVPVYFHWSFPVGGILISLYSSSDIEKTIYYIFSYSILVIVHELGHLIAAKCMRLEVFAVEVSGAGGLCHFENPKTFNSAMLIYSGGLMAQIVLFIFSVTYLSLFSYPINKLGFSLIITFTLINVIMFILNVIPSKLSEGAWTDGSLLWKLIKTQYGKA